MASDSPTLIHHVHHVVRRLPRPGLQQHSVAWFLGALVALFMVSPFVEQLSIGSWIETSLLTAVLLSAVLAIGARKRMLIAAIVLVIPAVALRWTLHLRSARIAEEWAMVSAIVFTAFVLINLLDFVLKAKKVNSEVLCAGIASYLLLGLIWAYLYMLTGAIDPGAFTCTLDHAAGETVAGFNAVYFSIVTMNGAAFGDFMPVSKIARMLAMVQTTVGLFYLAVLISRLVSLYAPREAAPEA